MLNPGGRFTGAKLARLMRTMGSDSPVASSDSFRSKFQGATLADDVIAKPTTPVVLQRLLMEFGLAPSEAVPSPLMFREASPLRSLE